ncbi:MAG: riboflavin synthase [Streptosporangiaceae bacterium]
MFTGIIEELGTVAGLEQLADSARITIKGPIVAATAADGGSIAVSGVCLTVTSADDGEFTADVMGETLARSSLGVLAVGDRVNLERPVLAGDRLDGHIVQGHVDGTGVVTQSRPADRWHVLRIAVPADLARYIAQKGSVAVDGVSLTVSAVSGTGGSSGAGPEHWFEVSLIPETLARTTLGGTEAGHQVNIEVDVIAKYVERLLAGGDRA